MEIGAEPGWARFQYWSPLPAHRNGWPFVWSGPPQGVGWHLWFRRRRRQHFLHSRPGDDVGRRGFFNSSSKAFAFFFNSLTRCSYCLVVWDIFLNILQFFDLVSTFVFLCLSTVSQRTSSFKPKRGGTNLFLELHKYIFGTSLIFFE